MTTKRITLPLPDKDLSPNARPNRYAKSRKVKQARTLASREAYQAMNEWEVEMGFVVVSIRYVAHWKTKRFQWDDTNLISSCKAYEDGLQDAFGQDDSTWKVEDPEHYTDKTNPRLEIYITIEEL